MDRVLQTCSCISEEELSTRSFTHTFAHDKKKVTVN
jgi:hypothetical protein